MVASRPVSETEAALDRFLRSVQRRALIAARLSVPADDALDCVQSAMFSFVRKYRRKPQEQWRPLFFRVLYNALKDWQRRRAVSKALSWTSAPDEEADPNSPQPDRWLASGEAGARLVEALKRLPLRQQQAFILRHWEGLDTEATARALGVSRGTVKTHLSRALERLREALEQHHDPAH